MITSGSCPYPHLPHHRRVIPSPRRGTRLCRGPGERTDLLGSFDGIPDGMCVDAAGNLWIAVWGAGRVHCHEPDGVLRAMVEVPAPHTSSVAFAGPDLDVLVITTALEGMGPHDRAAYPDSGRLFTAGSG